MASRKQRPARTDEGREAQLISKAWDLAERQIEEGTASSQVITHFLKAGSTRERIEKERLKREVELLEAKVDSLQSATHMQDLFEKAMRAFKGYSGQEESDEYEEDFDERYEDGYDEY